MAIVPRSGSDTFFNSRVARPSTSSDDAALPAAPTSAETLDAGSSAFFQRRRQADVDGQAAFRAASKANPDQARKANRLAPFVGLPADTVERNLGEIEHGVRADTVQAAMRSNPRLAAWMGQPRNAAAASDDVPTLKSISDQFQAFWGKPKPPRTFAQRAWDIANTDIMRAVGITKSPYAMQSDMARNDGFFDHVGDLLNRGTAAVQGGLARAQSTMALPWARESNLASARVKEEIANANVAGTTTWDDVKRDRSVGTTARFALDAGIESVPGMAIAMLGPAGVAIYGASQAGSIGQQRANNNGRDDATFADVISAAPAAAASALLERAGIDRIFHAAGKSALRRTAGAAAGEGVTEFLQSGVEYAGGTVGTDKGFSWSEALDKSLAGMVAGAGMGGTIRGAYETANSGTRRVVEAVQARAGGAMLDRLMTRAQESRLRDGDPDAFQAFLAAQAQGTPVENIFIPAETIRGLYQDQGLDWSDPNDELFGVMADDFREQMEAGLASGGDVILPTAAVAARLAGTPEWERIRPDVRLAPGGVSQNEAQAIEDSWAEEMAARAKSMTEDLRAEQEAAEPRQRVFDAVFSMSRQSGFSLNASRAYADLWAERYATRAERLGDGRSAFDLFEASVAGIQADVPGTVEPYRRGDQLDVLINAMRRGAEPAAPSRPSLVDWIIDRGGIEDTGGDVASMGGASVFRGGYFGRAKRPLIRSGDGGDMFDGAGRGRSGLDVTLQDAIAEGYFPELQRDTGIVGGVDDGTAADAVDIAPLLEAIDEELRGNKRYPIDMASTADETQAAIAQAADDLRGMLEARGVDPEKATKAEISRAIDDYNREQEAERSLDQSSVDTDTAAFKRWFGDSKAVDSAGKPLVVYHGTFERFDQFDATLSNGAFFFSDNADVARNYGGSVIGGNLIAAYLSLQNPLIVDAGGKQGDIATHVNRAKDLGHDGLIVRNMDDVGGLQSQFVAFAPSQIKSATDNSGAFDPNDPRILYQSNDQEGKRGRIDFLTDGRASITLFEGRDLSTLLHEGGHLWLEELRGDAVAAGGKLADDWGAVKAWFAKEGVDVGDDGDIPTEAHELWARGMERYFMEGKTPSSALSGAFASFRAWLLRIYQVVSRLGSNITPDVRGVMDRLIASDNAIAWAIHESETRLMFDATAATEQLGMTGAEFNAYAQLLDDNRTEAFNALLYRTMERIRRARTKEYRDEEAKVRLDVTEEVNGRPEVRALHMLRGANGEDYRALDREAVIEMIGKEGIKLIPAGRPGKASVRAGGVHPDLMAELAGFRSGRELLDALIGIETRRKELVERGDKRGPIEEAIDIETDRVMADRQPDAFDDGSIEEEALEAIHNDKGAAILAAEARQLARKVGEAPTPAEVIRSWAERVVREGKIVDQASAPAVARHQRSEKAAARAAEAAFLAGDMADAFRQKQKQMVANALYRAARDAKASVDVIGRRLERLARSRGLKGLDPEYLDRIHELLERYDLRKRSEKDVRERESFDKWAKAQEEKGIEVFIPERLTMAGNVNFTRMTLDDLTALDDAVQSLAHLGREKSTMLLAQREADFNALVQEAQGVALGLRVRPWTADRNPPPSRLRELDAMLTKIEFLADQLDDGNPNGVFNRVLVQQATHAANEKERLVRKVVDPLARLYLDMPAAQQRRLAQKVVVGEFVQLNPETREITPTTFTRMELIAVALNTGNKSNMDKMLQGETMSLPEALRLRYGWRAETVQEVLDRELTKEDWDFVQATWDQIDTLWPDIVRSEREITGVTPEKIEPREVVTAHGTYRGGYYPLVYDPSRSQIAADNSVDDASKMLGQMGRSVATPKGHTITRTNAALPITFSVERVLLNHINRVTTRIAYGRYVRDTLKFISDPRIRKIVDEHAGLEYHAQLRPWLQRQVNEAALDTATLSGFNRVMRQFRVNATMVGLGFRFTTMIAQVAGWGNSVAQIGPRYMARGMMETARNMGSIRGWVFDQSPEMASRAQSFDRDVRTFYTDLVRSGRREDKTIAGRLGRVDSALKLDKLRGAAFWGIGMIDVYLVAMPTWVGAYYKGIDEGMTIEQARAYGDKVVRESQSAGRAKDLAAIQDGPEAMRFATMFYSYFNVLYNKQRESVHAARSGDWRRAAVNVWWLMMVGPVASALLTGDVPGGEDDEETWYVWALRKIGFGMFASLPIIRDIAAKAERELSGKFAGEISPPIYKAFAEIERPIGDIVSVSKGEEPSERWLRNAITPAGYFLGLPTGQIGTTAQYALDVAEGDQKPKGASDVAYGIAKGPQEDQR